MANIDKYSMKKIALLFTAFTFTFIAHAQWGASAFMDVGSNQVSNGVYANWLLMPEYKIKPFTFSIGTELDASKTNSKALSGYRASGEYTFAFSEENPLSVQLSYMGKRFGTALRETNTALQLNYQRQHIRFSFGNAARVYTYTRKGMELYNLNPDYKRLTELGNWLYRFGYYIKPFDADWNLGLNITSFDYFIYSQETNPIFYLEGNYKIKDNWKLRADFWYKSAGALNLSVNYFGIVARVGVIWELSKKED